MEIVLSLLTLVGLVASDVAPGEGRVAELHSALDRAVMLHESSARSRERARDLRRSASAASRETELDLIYLELDTGFLAKSCVCREDQVFRMRMMITYAQFLRAFGWSDAAIVEEIAAGAGGDAPRVRQLLGFAGLDGIEHFICVDYLRAALGKGMPVETLRGYIDEVAVARTRRDALQVASAR